MQKGLGRKGLVFGVIMLFVGGSVASSINGNDKSQLSNDTEKFTVNNMSCCDPVNKNTIAGNNSIDSANRGSDVEVFSINYNENIDILETGEATVDLFIDIPSSNYADIYRKMLGVPADVEIETEIPIPEDIIATEEGDKILISTGRESFYNSVSKDQWYMLGLFTEISESQMMPFGLNGECKIELQADAFVQINNFREDTWNISLGPYVTGNMSDVNRFVCLGIGYNKLMLESIPGEQVFQRKWITRITLPEESSLVNAEMLRQLNWMLDFGGGTVLKAFISSVSESTIILEEVLTITENDDFYPVVFSKYKSFDVEYFLADSSEKYDPSDFHPIRGGDRGTIFEWGSEFGGSISDSFNVGPIEVDYELSCYVNFLVLITTSEATVTTSVDASADLTATFTADYVYDSGWIDIVPPYRWWILGWILFVPIWLEVEAGPEFKIEAGAEAGLTVSTGAWVHAELEMGAQYGHSQGFDLIWRYDFDYGYTLPTIDEFYFKAWVKPAISFPIKAKIYSIIGPIVRPEIYLLATIKYLAGELYQSIKLGFSLSVGVCIGIPLFSDICWEWSIFDFKIWEWNNIDPPDTIPPTTEIHMYPKKYGWTGRNLWVWFNTTDDGEIPSGVDETWFKIDDNDWMLYNYSEVYKYIVTDPDQGPYYIWYNSTDDFGNPETTKSRSVNVDPRPPISTIEIGDPSNDHIVFSYHTPIILEAQDDQTGWEIWYRVGDCYGGFSPWKNGGEYNPVTYHFTVDDEGEYFLEWSAMDGVWNLEDKHSECFYVKAGVETVYNVSLMMHRIKQIDDIDPGTQADWYYHVGFSEDENMYYWHSSPIPIVLNQDDIIIDETHNFFTGQNVVYIDIMVCEYDGSASWDDLADVSSDYYEGEINKANTIDPPSIGIEYGSYSGFYDIINDDLYGAHTEPDGIWLITSGEFDYNSSHTTDAAAWFNINATVYNILPVAEFTYMPSDPTIKDIIQFTDLSNDSDGDIISWYWEFGDGDISTDQNPTHNYLDNGTYPVSLTVMDDKGGIDVTSKNITVGKPVVYVDDDYNSSTPGWQIDHFLHIQEGIDAVDEDGTVYVFNGTYNEGVEVNKTVDLIGENRETTIVNGISGPSFKIIANNSYLSGFSCVNNSLIGVLLSEVENCQITQNKIIDNDIGLVLSFSTNNMIYDNNIKNNSFVGILTEYSYDNTIYHNNLGNNTFNAADNCSNSWDNGYPSGGNYWDDHPNPVDEFSGPNQDIPGSDGIVDTPYDIPGDSSQDLYPFMNPWMDEPNNPPNVPSDPIPVDLTTGIVVNPEISILVSDPDGDAMDVSFYDASGPTLIGTMNGVASGTRASVVWSGLAYSTTYYWYAVADDGEYLTQSDTWEFTTMAYNFHSVYGYIYIDDVIAPSGIEVKLSFPGEDVTDYTDTTGFYDINFQGHDWETGYFYVYYDGIWYIPVDNPYVDIEDEIGYNVDLHIDTGAPANLPPTADAGGPYDWFLNVPITLDGSGSFDPDGTIVSWLWDLGDENTSTDQNPTHTYTSTGTFPLSLTVTDDDGATDTDSSSTITIVDDIEPPSKVTGLTVTDAKDGKLDLAWNAATDNYGVNHYRIYRDGSFLTTVTSTSYQDTGLTNGQSYEYEVSAVDISGNEGEKSDPVSGIPTVSGGNIPPIADAGGPYIATPYEEITFDGSGSTDPEETDLDYRWDFDGDGEYDTVWSLDATATYSYANDGIYTVILQVRDAGGLTDTDETTTTIITPNTPPTAPEVTGVTIGLVDTEYTYTVVSTDEDNDTIQYIFNWDDGNTSITEFLPSGTSFSINHSWAVAGEYIISVQANDNKSYSDTTELPVTIYDELPSHMGIILSSDTVNVGDNFTATIYIDPVEPIGGWQIYEFNFTQGIVNATEITPGAFWETNFDPGDIDNENGTITDVQVWSLGPYPDVNHTACMINFTALQLGICTFEIMRVDITNDNFEIIPLITQPAMITVVDNMPPFVYDEYPQNESIDVERPPSELNVTIEDPNDDAMNIYIKWRKHDYYHFGEWVTLASYTGVYDGTYNFIPPYENDWIWGNTTYIWSVNVTDGTTWTNATYQYTTDGSRYDVNNDDNVNFQDAGLVWIHRTSEVPYDGIYDVNQDGQVNFQDAGLTWINRD